MILIILLATVLGGVLVWALYTEDVPARPQPSARRLDVAMSGAQMADHDFALVPVGYDPRQVDAHLRRMGRLLDEQRATRRDAGAATLPSVLDD